MKISDLLISGVDITEDNYHYIGQFILSSKNKSINLDLAELNGEEAINLIKETFDLEESNDEIRQSLIDRLVIKAGISSKDVQGENYFEKKNCFAKGKNEYTNRA